MKVKRVLLSIVLILIVALLFCSTSAYATTGSWKLGAEQIREGITTKNGENGIAQYNNTRYSYQMNNKSVLKIVDKTTGTPDFRNAIYCVKAGQGFGSAEFNPANPITDVTYNTYFDMVTEKGNVNSILNLTDANYNSLMWLLDNIYLPKQSSEDLTVRYNTKVDLLYEAFKNEINNPNSDFYHYTMNDFCLTDDDIEVVQQWAIWYFTNSGDSTYHLDTLPPIQVSEVGGNATHTSLNDKGFDIEIGEDTIKEGYLRGLEAEVLYKYLIEAGKEHSDYTPAGASEMTLNKTLRATVKKVGTSYVFGPFEITTTGNPKSFVGSVVYKDNKSLIEGTQYTICDANGNSISRIGTLAEAVGNGQFYIKVSNAIIQNDNIEDLTLKIDYVKDDTTKTFWTVNGSTVDQPVVVVERETNNLSDNIKIDIPEFDLALRKHIVSVTRDGKTVSIQELNGRTPSIDKTNLKTNTNNKTDTTAVYKHRKDPVPVQTGDMVEYAITIYNEGEIAGRATKIVDYLPSGLEFSSANSTNYNFEVSADKRTITITPKSGYVKNLAAYDGVTLASEEIRLVCVVTKKEDKNIDEDTILTNIAQITECYDVNNVKMYEIGDDRDSEPNNAVLPTGANLPYYKGNELNKTDLTDNTYFYKGQQDDDDFEKLKVTTLEFDLALRKFITHIDGKEITTSREPIVDTTPLKNGTDTTAIYKHPKNPLVVRLGGTVTYTIRIYNEGVVDGFVTVIEDYLPAELEMVPVAESTINAKYAWNANGRVVTTTYLNGEVIKAYDGGNTLNYKDVEIECKIKDTANYGKILTNIAQINGASRNDDRDSTPSNVQKPSDINLPNYKGNELNKADLTDNTYFYKGQEDDDDFEKVMIYTPGFDLALRKFITHINGVQIEVSREPIVDTTPLKNESGTTAIYTHPKNPLTINIGDKITYKIRVYNEGEADGKATVIEDYLPEELEMVPIEESGINAKYGWISSGRIITTTYLKDDIIKAYDGGDTLDYKDVEIECRLKETENLGKVLTNIAQINGASRDDDRDSTPSNVVKPSDEELPNYKKNQEDDDDFEKVIIYQPQYDLALRKFIVEVDGKKPQVNRSPVVDVTPLINGTDTTAIYTHTKEPLLVKNGNIVVYTIRVYNEGKYDGYAELVKDNIPEGLEFVIDNEVNIEYRWRLSDDEKSVSTDYLSKARDKENVIKAFDSKTMKTLDYKDVKIAFKVVEPNTSTRIITNIAEIKDDDGKDIDSTPDNNVPDEDDIDVEHVKLRYFDLALRKFITKVESKTGENLPIETDTTKDVSREPKVEVNEDGSIKYVHPKDPVIVANTDIVIYTLRVYNEGTIDGFAEEIKDDVPVGLELVPEHEINVKYGWVMYDKDGNVTNDVIKAKTIRTTYLSEAKDAENIIKAFDRDTMTTPNYKDVQVAFKIVEKDIDEGRIVINTAEISKDSDDDEDSTPDNDKPDEDDIDKEYVKVKYFDLALLKWVSKVSVTRNGKTTVTDTGYNGLENPEPLVKTEIKTSEIKSIIIKYEYGIKITNEGEIAGYAKEVADYIPKGLEFIPEDNPLWTVEKDGKIVTTQLADTLLQPGESAIIHVVFKWINNENNFGQKENIAEISKDYNDKDTPDKDSTPNNEVPEEDDQDNAFVIISPKTGTEKVIFIVLPTIILTIITVGIILIKKYVL